MIAPSKDECSFEALEAKVLLSASIFDVDLIESDPVEDNSLVLIQEDLSEQQLGGLSEEFDSFVIEPGESLQGEGELDAAVVNEGVIAPGNSPGEVEFESLDNSDGELSIEIGGTDEAGVDYDLITVEEGVTLGGKLKVSVLEGYVPQIGDEFEFLTFSESIGDFLEFEGLEIGGGDMKFVPILTDTGYNLLVSGTTITVNPITGFSVTVGEIRNTATGDLINEQAEVTAAINSLFSATPTDASYSFFGDVELNGLELGGEFTIAYSSSTLSLQASNVNAIFEVSPGKGFKVSNGSLSYTHNGGDYSYSVSGNAAVVGFDGISLAGSFSMEGDHEGADSLSGTLTEFEVLDVVSFSGSLSATYDFVESQLRISGSDIDAKVQAGNSFAGINDGELALLVDSAGKVAVSASGSASITLNGFSSISADSFTVSFNNTGATVAITPASEGEFGLTVSDGVSSFTAENFNGVIDGFAKVSGTLSFEYDALKDSLIVLGDSLTVESFSDDQDIALLDAEVALVVNNSGIVFDARGDPRLGLPVFDTVTVGTFRFKYNDTGADFDQNLTIGDTSYLLQVENGVTDIIVTNFAATLSGFAAFSGNLSFRYDENKKQLFGFGSDIQLNLEGLADSVVVTEGEISFLINSENNIVINASAKMAVDNALLTSLNLDALAIAFSGFTVEKIGFSYNNTGADFSQEVTVGAKVYYLAGNDGETLVYFQGFEATVATFAKISGDFYFYYDADTTEVFGFGRNADIDFVTLANGDVFNNGTISLLVDANDKLAMNVSFGVEITPETLALFSLDSLDAFDSFSIGKLGFSFNETGSDLDRSFEIAGETLELVAEDNVNVLFANDFSATINDFVSLTGNLYFEYDATADELTAVGYDISAGYYDDLNTVALTNGNLVLFIDGTNKFAIEIRGSPNLTLSGFASFTAAEVFISYNNTGSDYTVDITVGETTVTRTIVDGALKLGVTSGILDFNGVNIEGTFAVTILADDHGLDLTLTTVKVTIDGVLQATVASGLIKILNIFDGDGAFVRSNIIADIEGLSVTSALSGVTFTGTYNLYLRFTDSLTHIGLETTESIDIELLNFSFNGELNFIYSKDHTSGDFVLLLDVDKGIYSLADGVIAGTELSGSFVIINGEIGGMFTTQVAFTIPGVSITTDEFTFIYSNFTNGLEATFEFTDFTLDLNFDSGLYVFIEALGVDISLAGMTASGNAAFRLVRNTSDEWNVYLLFNNLAIGDGTNSLKNGSGVFYVISAGVAGEIYGEVALDAGVADANGAFKLRVNTTEDAVDESFSLAGIDYDLQFNDTTQAAENYFSFALIDAVFRIGDNIQVSGETVAFEEDEDGNKTFYADGLSVFVGDGIAFLEGGQINDSAFGFLMTNVAVVIYQNADGEILFQAVNGETGVVSLVGSDEVKFSGSFAIKYNETTDLKSVTIPDDEGEDVTLTFEDDEVATDDGAFIQIEAVDVEVEIVDVVTFSGGLLITFDRVSKQIRIAGNEMSARVTVGSNFIGFDEGEVDLLINEEGKVAIQASGSGVAQIEGFSSSSIELFEVSYNNTGSDISIFDGDFSLDVDNNVFELIAQGFVSEINGFSKITGSLNVRYDADENSIVLLGENMSVELLSDNVEIGIFNGQVALIINESGLVFDARGDPVLELSVFDTPSVETIRFRYNDTGADVDETLVIGDLEFHLQVETGVTDIILIGFDASLSGFGSISGNLFLSYNENTKQIAAIGTGLSIRLGGINGGALITEGVITFLLNSDNTIAINARGKVVVNTQFLAALNLSALSTAFSGFSVEQVGLSFNNTGQDVAQEVTIADASEFLLAENNKALLLFEGFEATIAGFVSFTGNFYFVYDEDNKQIQAFGRDAEVNFVNLEAGSTLSNGELVLLVNEDGTLALNVSATLTITDEILEDLGLSSLSALDEFKVETLGYSYNNTGADIFTSFGIAGDTFFLSAENGVNQLFARNFSGSIAGFIEFSGNLFFEYDSVEDELIIIGYDINAGYFDENNTIALKNGNLVLLIDKHDNLALEIRGSPDVRLQGFASFTAAEVIISYNNTGATYTKSIVVNGDSLTRTITNGLEFTINDGVLDFNGVTLSGSFTVDILPDSEGLDFTFTDVTVLIDGVLTGAIATGNIEIRTQKDTDGNVVSSNVNADIEGIEITSLITDVSFTGLYKLSIKTSAETAFVKFETVENIEATIYGLELSAAFNFIYEEAAQGEYVLLLNVSGGSLSLADGLFSSSEIQGSFVIVNGEMGGTFSTQLEINIPGISFAVREFTLSISNFQNGFEDSFEFTNFTLEFNFGSGLYISIVALDLDLTLAGTLSASANASFTLLRGDDSEWKIYLAFSDASIGDSDNSLVNGRGVFYIDASGIAGEIVGEVGLSAGAFEAQGSMKFLLNTTEKVINETFSLGGEDYALSFSSTAETAANYFNFSILNASFQLGEYLKIEGNFEFTTDDNGNEVFHGSDLRIFLGDGIAYIEEDELREDAFGIAILDATVTLVQFADGTKLFKATGSAKAIGSADLTLSGDITAVYNSSSETSYSFDDAGGTTRTTTLGSTDKATDGVAYIDFGGSNLKLQVGDVYLSGSFAFEIDSLTGTIITIGATDVNVFVGEGGSTSVTTDDKGLSLEDASGLFVFSKNGIAGSVKGGISVIGYTEFSFTGDFEFQINTFRDDSGNNIDYSASIKIADGSTVSFSLPKSPYIFIQGTGVSLTVLDSTLSGDFAIEYTSSEETGFQLRAALSNIDVAFGDVVQVTNALGVVQITSDGLVAGLRGGLSATLDSVSVTGEFTLLVNATSEPVDSEGISFGVGEDILTITDLNANSIVIRGDNVNLNIGDVHLSGNITFSYDSTNKVTLLALSSASIALYNNGAEIIKGSIDEVLILITPEGVVLQTTITIDEGDVSVDQLEFSGTFELTFQNLTAAVETDYKVGNETKSIDLEAGVGFSFSATNLAIKIGDQTLTGNLAFKYSQVTDADGAKTSTVTITFSEVTASIGYGSGDDFVGVTIANGAGVIEVNGQGVVGYITATPTLTLHEDIVISATTVKVLFNTTAVAREVFDATETLVATIAPNFIGIKLTGLTFSISTLSLTGDLEIVRSTDAGSDGEFGTTDDEVTIAILITNLGVAADGDDPGLSGGRGFLIITDDGVAGYFFGKAAATVGSFEAGAEIGFAINTTGAAVDTKVQLTSGEEHLILSDEKFLFIVKDAEIDFGGLIYIEGNLATSGDLTVATGVKLFIGAGPYMVDGAVNPDAIGVELTNVRLALLYESAGKFALVATGNLSLIGLDGLTVKGTVSVLINTLGRAIDKVGVIPGVADSSIEIKFTTAAQVFEVVATYAEISIAGYLALTANQLSITRLPNGDLIFGAEDAAIQILDNNDVLVKIQGDATFNLSKTNGFELISIGFDGITLAGQAFNLPTLRQSSTPAFKPSAYLIGEFASGSVTLSDWKTNGYVDIYFGDLNRKGLNESTIKDVGQEFAFYDADGNIISDITINGAATAVANTFNTYQYTVTIDASFTATQTITVEFIAESFADQAGIKSGGSTEVFDVLASATDALTPIVELKNNEDLSIDDINAKRFIDVTVTSRTDDAIDLDALFAKNAKDIFSLSGSGAVNADISSIFKRSDNTVRIFFTAKNTALNPFAQGEIIITAKGGQIGLVAPSATVVNRATTMSLNVVSATQGDAGKSFTIGAVISVENLSFFIDGMSFSGGTLTVDLGIAAGKGELTFGSEKATLEGIFVTFAIEIDALKLLQFDPSALTPSKKFFIGVSEFEFKLNGIIEADAKGVYLSWDENGGDDQEILRIQEASVLFPKFNLKGVIKENGSDPGLLVTGKGIKFGTAEIQYTQSVSLGVVSFDDLRVGITGFGFTFDGQVNFTGELYFATGGAQIKLGNALTAKIYDSTADTDDEAMRVGVTFTDGEFDGFIFKADSFEVAIAGGLLTIKAEGFDFNLDAKGKERLVYFTKLSAQLKAGLLDVKGEARNFGVAGDGSFIASAGFAVILGGDGVDSNILGLPAILPVNITKLGLIWKDINNDISNFNILISASVNTKIGSMSLSGFVRDLVISPTDLANGKFPIVSLGSVGVSAGGTVGGAKVTGTLVLGLLQTDAAGNEVDALNPNANPVVKSTIYLGIAGTMVFPGGYGFGLQLGISDVGILSLGLSVNAVIPLDAGFCGGCVSLTGGSFLVDFGIEIDDINSNNKADGTPWNTTDVYERLRQLDFSVGEQNASEWDARLRAQTLELIRTAGTGNVLDLIAAQLTGKITLAGSATGTLGVGGQGLNFRGTVAMDTAGKFYIQGDVFPPGEFVTMAARMYFDLSPFVDAFKAVAEGDAPPTEFNFSIVSIITIPDEVKFIEIRAGLTFGGDFATGIFGFTLSGSYRVYAPFVDVALVVLSGEATLEFDIPKAKMELRFTTNAYIIGLGDIGRASGAFIAQVKDGNVEIFGAILIETGIDAFKDYGLEIEGDGYFAFNLSNRDQLIKIDLLGFNTETGQFDKVTTVEQTVEALSATVFVAGSVFIKDVISDSENPTTLLSIQGLVYLNIARDGLKFLAVGELNAAGFLNVQAAAAFILRTDYEDGDVGRNGIAGMVTVDLSAGPDTGLPLIDRVFEAELTTTVAFNTTLDNQVISVPAFLTVRTSITIPTKVLIYASQGAPTLGSEVDETQSGRGPPNGEVYFFAKIFVRISILDGAILLVGEISISAGENGSIIQGRVTGSIKYIGAVTGTLYLETTENSAIGRIALDVDANLGILAFNGNFLLEINTTSSEKTVHTYKIIETRKDDVLGFDYDKDASGELKVGAQTIASGIKLIFSGDVNVELGFTDVKIQAYTEFQFGPSEVSLVMDGKLEVGSFFTFQIIDSGFIINNEGVVTNIGLRFESALSSLGMGVFGEVRFQLNTTSGARTIGTTVVKVGTLIDIQGSISFVGLVSIKKVQATLAFSPGQFSLSFSGELGISLLALNVSGSLDITTAGVKGSFAVNLNLGLPVIGVSGNLTASLDTGASSFKIKGQASFNLFGLLSFRTNIEIGVGKGDYTGYGFDNEYIKGEWYFTFSSRTSFFGVSASISGFLDSRLNFDFALNLGVGFDAGIIDVSGSISFKMRGEWDEDFTSYTASASFTGRISGTLDLGIASVGASASISATATATFSAARIKAGGVLTLGLSMSVSGSLSGSACVGAWKFKVCVSKSFGFNTSLNFGTMNFTGLTIPSIEPLATEGASESDAILKVGDRKIDRTVAEQEANEVYTIIKVGETYVINAFGEEQEFDNITKITGYFTDGDDGLILGQGINVELDITFSSGTNFVTIREGNTISGRIVGGSDKDTFTFNKGTYNLALDGGEGENNIVYNYSNSKDTVSLTEANDAYLLKTDNDTGISFVNIQQAELNLKAGDDDVTVNIDTVADLSLTINLEAGSDTFHSLNNFNGSITGGANSDTINLATSSHAINVDAGSGTDKLFINHRSKNTTTTLAQGADTKFTVTVTQNALITVNQLEELTLNLSSLSNSIFINSLDNTNLDQIDVKLTTGGVDALVVRGKVDTDDTFTLTDDADSTDINVSDRYTISIFDAARADYDTLRIDLENKNNTLDAYQLTHDRLALTVVSGDGHDYIKASQFNDIIEAGAGNNWVVGNLGVDTITTLGGNDTILGDEGTITGDILTNRVTIQSSNLEVGSNDTISSTGGNNTIIGGAESDTITTGAGNDYIFGDNAGFTYAANGVLNKATTLASSNGGIDVINAGSGTNTIIGGVAADTITTTDGDDYIFGDDAEFTYYTDGILNKATTLASSNGGVDQINAGSGANTVIGGVAADTITTNDGDDYIFGDDAEFNYDANGLLSIARSIASENGAADIIDAGNRHNTIIGGVGADSITSTNGNDYIFGDDAEITYEVFSSLAIVSVAKSLASENGGNDTIDAGNGNNFIIGGVGADTINASQGDDYVFGDDAELSYSSALLTRARTIASDNGGDDVINLHSGNHFVIGGVGADSITVLGGVDYVFGDDADLEYDIVENRTYLRSAKSLASLNGGNDTLLLGAGDNQAVGGVGQDLIVSFAGNDFVFGDDAHLRYNQGAFVEATSLTSSNGNDDTIRVGSGEHFIVGGAGADEIESSEGDDYIFGDNAVFEYTNGILSKATSLSSTTGGNDNIEAGSGNNTVIGGAGEDSVEVFEGADFVFGDDAVFEYIEGNLSKVSTIASTDGDDDYIDAGAGDNILIGGSGSDTILSFAGLDINIGDDAEFIYSNGSLVTLRSLTNTNGGNDQIDSSEGNNIVIGGFGDDQLTAFSGNDIIFGDEAEITFDNTAVTSAISINTASGGLDLIEAGTGDNSLIGGESTDRILSFSGDDLIFGDSADIRYANNRVISAISIANSLGAADRVEAGAGKNTLFGGEGSDRLVSGDNTDYVFGDNGRVVYGESGVESLISIDTVNAGNDAILSGKGDDVAIGGEGNDTIATADGNDLIIGDHGTLTYVSGYLSRVISRLSSGDDNIIAGSGDNTIIAGGGEDTVSALNGNDTIFGDDADLKFESASLVSAKSLISFYGGADNINAGSGRNIIIGGERSDTLQSADGDDLIFGDSARIDYLNNSEHTATSFLNPFGSADTIEAGTGINIIIGGEGEDILENGEDSDVIFDDYGSVTFEVFLPATVLDSVSHLDAFSHESDNTIDSNNLPLIYPTVVNLNDLLGVESNVNTDLEDLFNLLTNSEEELEEEFLWVIAQMIASEKITNELFDLINSCVVNNLATQIFQTVDGNKVAAIE